MKSQISIKKLVLVALFLGAIGLINAQTTAVPGPRDEIKIPSSSCQFERKINNSPPLSDLNEPDQSSRGVSNNNSTNTCGFNLLSIYWYQSNSLYNELIKGKSVDCFFRLELGPGYNYAKRAFFSAKNMNYISKRLKTIASSWTAGQTNKMSRMISLIDYLRAGSHFNFNDSGSFYHDDITTSYETYLKTNLTSLIYKTLADNYATLINWDFDSSTALAEPSDNLMIFLSEIIALHVGGGFRKIHKHE